MSKSSAALSSSIRAGETEVVSLAEMVKRLETLLQDDETEQRETFACLKQAVDQDRSSDRRRFGPA